MEEKACLDCGQAIKVGRSDKKFCDDTCRTNYNNRQKELKQEQTEHRLPEFITDVNAILAANWRILKECLGNQDSCRMKVRDLSGRNFNFKFFTSERVNDGDQEPYYFCYDIGYKYVEDDRKVVIVQSSKEVKLTGQAYRFEQTGSDSLG
jgi:hypothetical protein